MYASPGVVGCQHGARGRGFLYARHFARHFVAMIIRKLNRVFTYCGYPLLSLGSVSRADRLPLLPRGEGGQKSEVTTLPWGEGTSGHGFMLPFCTQCTTRKPRAHAWAVYLRLT